MRVVHYGPCNLEGFSLRVEGSAFQDRGLRFRSLANLLTDLLSTVRISLELLGP